MAKSKTYSRISKIHYAKLCFRSMLLLAAITLYALNPAYLNEGVNKSNAVGSVFLAIIWVVFIPEMIRRFFPNDNESSGCQKQFRRNFKPKLPNSWTDEVQRILGRTKEEIQKKDFRDAVIIAVFWVVLNGIIGVLYFTKVIDAGILIIISMFYAVSDIICILFWCPFQSLVMKNTCCAHCRIYNWDYIMMFTPLIFIGGFWALSLVFCAALLLVKWEFDYYRHPDRFNEETNAYLSCIGCNERLCKHKVSVQKRLVLKTRNLAKAQAQVKEHFGKTIDTVSHVISDKLEK